VGAGYTINRYLTIGISRYQYNLGEEANQTDSLGNPVAERSVPKCTFNSLNLSSQPFKNLFIGINTTYFNGKYREYQLVLSILILGSLKNLNSEKTKPSYIRSM
jgi:hypothetical protein